MGGPTMGWTCGLEVKGRQKNVVKDKLRHKMLTKLLASEFNEILDLLHKAVKLFGRLDKETQKEKIRVRVAYMVAEHEKRG